MIDLDVLPACNSKDDNSAVMEESRVHLGGQTVGIAGRAWDMHRQVTCQHYSSYFRTLGVSGSISQGGEEHRKRAPKLPVLGFVNGPLYTDFKSLLSYINHFLIFILCA